MFGGKDGPPALRRSPPRPCGRPTPAAQPPAPQRRSQASWPAKGPRKGCRNVLVSRRISLSLQCVGPLAMAHIPPHGTKKPHKAMGKFINPFTGLGFKHIFGHEITKELPPSFLNDLSAGEFQIAGQTFKNPVQPVMPKGSRPRQQRGKQQRAWRKSPRRFHCSWR